jgi:hypothetical protein
MRMKKAVWTRVERLFGFSYTVGKQPSVEQDEVASDT